MCLECEKPRCTGSCKKFEAARDNIRSQGKTYKGASRLVTPMRLYTYKGKTQSASKWAAEYNISRDTLNSRLRSGMSIEAALTAPLYMNSLKIECRGELHAICEWGKISGVHPETIRFRLKKGWPVEDAIFKKPQRR